MQTNRLLEAEPGWSAVVMSCWAAVGSAPWLGSCRLPGGCTFTFNVEQPVTSPGGVPSIRMCHVSILAGPAYPDSLLPAPCWLGEERGTPWHLGGPLQVRGPGVGGLGLLCLPAAQCVCTRPPFGYLTNTGSQKGFWHIWQSFLSESHTELPFSFICKKIKKNR